MKQGTYVFSSMINKDEELKRLFKQAMVLPELEIDTLKKHGLKEGIKVLDAACGPGAVSCFLAQNINDIKITGVDMDGNLLKEAHKLADSNHLELEFLQGNIYDLPFYEEFDLVYCRFLFQHLSDPFKALENLYKALRPGGRLCITDVDDGWLSIYPEVPAFNHICQKACEIQSISGGDRLIGRKLHSYLKSSGFSDIKVDVIPVNSDQIGIKDFLNITTQFKKELLIKSGDHASQKYFDEVWEAAYSQELFGIVGAFVVSGLKA